MSVGKVSKVDASTFRSLRWRSIGPHRGGRVVAVAGHPTQQLVFYFGSTGGGVWKTSDAGETWQNISDMFFRTSSVGAIAVAQADPNVLYVGMGECCIRGNVSRGDGVYKTTDGGNTWTHMGLPETRHIARVRIHPMDPDLVYVAAFGHVFGPNSERGVYRSRDGAKTWQQILFRSKEAGAIDLSMDPTNPRILYAAFWEAYRTPWSLTSGGPGSSLYKSTDGGDTWTELTDRPGLPKGLKGRIGVAVSPAKPDRVWTVIEAEDGGVFRSDDGGDTWRRLNEDRELRQRAFYFTHVHADPQDPDSVYFLNYLVWKSIDGGSTIRPMATPHEDSHDMWIDSHDPRRMINGSDGGACVSFNGGLSWSTILNQPTGELYHVTTDNRFPYRVYGAQQDNSTLSVPSRSESATASITQRDWYDVGGGESGYIAARPDDPNIVYAGSYGSRLTRYDHRTREIRHIMVWPEQTFGWGAKDHKYRFAWTFPIVISPHDPDVLYITGNHVFRSTNEGTSWEVISPDLTLNDVAKMEPSGGPITKDNSGAEVYGTIFAFAESPRSPGVLWACTDDGLIHLSNDGGRTWENVTPKELPEWTLISIIEPSAHDPATAYVAATRYKLDDFHPYLFKTNNYGKNWTRITNGIPEDDFARVIREDPDRRGFLYAGTESGVHISFDDGASWQPLPCNLPAVPVHDLAVKDSDLVIATHGRGFWILDDLSAIRQIGDEVIASPHHLFKPRPTYRIQNRTIHWPDFKWYITQGIDSRQPFPVFEMPSGATHYLIQKEKGDVTPYFLDAGQNPPNGVMINYYLKEESEGEIILVFLDASGKVIRTFSSKDAGDFGDKKDPELSPPAKAGVNRFVWDMRYPAPVTVKEAEFFLPDVRGPLAPPGLYQVQLTLEGKTYSESFEIRKDPRVSASQEGIGEQFDLLIRIRDKITESHNAVNRIRSIRRQLAEWVRHLETRPDLQALLRNAGDLKGMLSAIEEELVQVRQRTRADLYNFPPKLNSKLAFLFDLVASGYAAPTTQSYEVFKDLSISVDEQVGRLEELIRMELHAFAGRLGKLDLAVIVSAGESSQ